MQKDKIDAIAGVEMALSLLNDIAASSYIPFSSPAPCSTEVVVKESILKSIRHLETALMNMRQLPYGKQRVGVEEVQLR